MLCFLLCVALTILSPLFYIEEEEGKWTLFYNQTVMSYMIPNRTMGSTCHQSSHFIDEEPLRRIYVNSTEPLSIKVSNISNPTSISPTITFDENSIFTITYNCDPSSELKWSFVTMHSKTLNGSVEFEILKICQTPSMIKGYLVLNSLVALILLVSIVKLQNMFTDLMVGSSNESAPTVTYRYVIILVVIGSAMLMSLFFLTKPTTILLTGILSFSAIISGGYVMNIILLLTLKKCNCIHISFGMPILGACSVSEVLSILASCIIVACYLTNKNWILNNLIAIFLCYSFLQQISLPKLKIGLILFVGTMIYDVFWVFASDYIFTKSVMVTVATEVDLPIKICMPHLTSLPLKSCSIIGLGDLVIPGIVMAYATDFGIKKKTSSYYLVSIVSYVVGLIVCDIVLFIYQNGQPALIYLCPAVFLGVLFLSLIRHEFKELWNGEEPVLEGSIEMRETIEEEKV